MSVALWKSRLSILITLSCLGVFAGSAFAQPPSMKRGRYKVRIESAPPGAKVYLDGKQYGPVGVTPWEGKLRRGEALVIVEKEGYQDAQKRIDVRRRRGVQDFFLPMVKKADPPKIDVRADADKNSFGAQVWIDGQVQGQVPVLVQVDAGRHLVEIKKEGFEPFTQWVEVKEDEKFAVNPILKEIPKEEKGSILIEADVEQAEVYIDGNRHKDVTPTLVTDVLAGPHVIEVRKEPAMPWKQTVQVIDGQTVKVSAKLQATMKKPGGAIRVLSNVAGAKVFLDGTELGLAPIDIKDVEPGDHVVEVKAPKHLTREERVKVSAGSATVLKLDLQPVASTETGTLKVVSIVPEAAVFIDGQRVGNVPQEKELPAGEHFVLVTKTGYRKFEQKVQLAAGKTMTVNAELAEVGQIRVLSTPSGAQVMMDGEVIGNTPYNNEEIAVGPHVIKLMLEGHYDYEKEISVQGGQRTIVNSQLEEINMGPTEEELANEQRSLSSFGARTLPLGRATIDIAGGYPHYLMTQVTVGFGRPGGFGLDAGAFARTFLARTEFGIKLRLNLYDKKPLSAGFFTNIGGGGSLIDDTQRNSFTVDLGAASSLTAFGMVTVTGRAYLNFWSDRHCPEQGAIGAQPIEVCEGNLNAEQTQRLMELGLTQAELVDREGGVRFMVSGAVEVAAWQNWSVWGVFELPPFQSERAAFTNLFNGSMLEQDVTFYLSLGGTYKF